MNYKSVKISEDARIAKQSVITGDVTIGRDSCVFYFAVIRGDEASSGDWRRIKYPGKLYGSCEP